MALEKFSPAEQRIITLLATALNAAPTADLLEEVAAAADAGASAQVLLNVVFNNATVKAKYPAYSGESTNGFLTQLVNNATAGTAITGETKTQWVAALTNDYNEYVAANPTSNYADFTVWLLDILATAEFPAGSDLAALQASLEVRAEAAAAQIDANPDAAYNPAAGWDQFVIGGDEPTPEGGEFFFTAFNNETGGPDNLKGTDGNDTFTGWIFDNQNTFQSGDRVDGGAGFDTVFAQIGLSQQFAITAHTTSVEKFVFQAQSTQKDGVERSIDNDIGNHGIDRQVQIDAQYLDGVRELWSQDSRSNLTIEDVRENSHETTVGWRSADAGDVNYEVYWSNDFITRAGDVQGGSVVNLAILDQLNYPEEPLKQHSYKSFTFQYEGETYSIKDLEVPESYEALENLVRSQIEAYGLGDTLTVTRVPNGFRDPQGRAGDLIVVSSSAGDVVAGEFQTGPSKLPGQEDDTYFKLDSTPGEVFPSLTSVDIVLDHVGRTSKAGDLVVGGISGSSHSGSKGIEQFNVSVDRDSWIGELRSTNRTLEVVNVVNIAENNKLGNGDLRIDGSANYSGSTAGFFSQFGLVDVRVFDASAMLGDVTLTAVLTGAVVNKYLNLKDGQDNPAGDNSDISYRDVIDTEFSYDFGAGDDTLELAIDVGGPFNASWGAAGREDFVLEIKGGAGNDDITVSTIGSQFAGLPFFEETLWNWYINSKLTANLSIDAGADDDVVRTEGSGDWVVDLGAGNDTYYADNSGPKATWIMNVDNDNGTLGARLPSDTLLNSLESDANDSYALFKTSLTVTLTTSHNGDVDTFTTEVPVTIPSIANGYKSTDLHINQAIKNAINSDAVLSKLLVAEDGPGFSLVVRSLIDGEFGADSLVVNLKAPAATSLTTAEVRDYAAANGLGVGATAAQVVNSINAAIAAFNAEGDYVSDFATNPFDLTGLDSFHTADNTVTGGLGDDVIVLGTGNLSNDTVVYKGFGNGFDTIVNFTAGEAQEPLTFEVADEVVGNLESFSVTFGDLTVPQANVGTTILTIGTGAGETVVDLSAAAPSATLIPGEDVAFAVLQELNADAGLDDGTIVLNGTTWTVEIDAGTNQLTFTATGANANVTDVVAGDFVYTAGVTGSVVVGDYVQGAPDGQEAQFATFELDLNDSIISVAGSVEFDGATINYAVGDGPIELAAKIAAASYDDWVITDNLDGTVSGVAKVAREVDWAEYETADFQADVAEFALNGGVFAVTDDDAGSDQVGVVEYTTITLTGGNEDFLDFSAYDIAGVVVDGVVVAGSSTGASYVSLVEQPDTDGVYEISFHEWTGDAFATAQLIATADFGSEKAFHADNFIF